MLEDEALKVWQTAVAFAAEQRTIDKRGRQFGWCYDPLDPLDIPTFLWSWHWPDEYPRGFEHEAWLADMLRANELAELARVHQHRSGHYFLAEHESEPACRCGALLGRAEGLARCSVPPRVHADDMMRRMFGWGRSDA